MRKVDTISLRGLSIFRDISEENFKRIQKGTVQEIVPEGSLILEEGVIPEYLFVIVSGMVDLYTTQGDRETTLTVLRPFRAFVLASVVGGLPCVQSARTMEETVFLKISGLVLRELLDIDPQFTRAVARELSVSYGCVSVELKNQKLRSGIERLANWILRTHSYNGQGNKLVLPYDKRTLASRIGMTPENLSRSLSQLAKYGVEVHGKEIVITDYRALRTLACVSYSC